MSALWAIATALTVAGALVVVLLARQAEREIGPTLRAFATLRDALHPAVLDLRAETGRTRGRVSALHNTGKPGQHG